MTNLPQLLYHRGRRFELKVPREVDLDPYSTWALLGGNIDVPPLTDALWSRLRELATHVAGHRDAWGPWTVRVGPPDDRATVYLDRVGHTGPVEMRCRECATPEVCPHALALLAAAGYDHADSRAFMEVPGWRRFLDALGAPATSDAAARAPDGPRGGRLRVNLSRHHFGATLVDGMASFSVVRRSADGRRDLKPKRFQSREALERLVVGLTEGERRVAERLDDLRALDEDERGHRIYRGRHVAGSNFDRLRTRLLDELFAALCDVPDLRLDDAPITWDPTPWHTALAAVDGPEGRLDLRWGARPQASFAVGPGYVVLDGRLRPVAPELPPRLLSMMDTAPPPVPGPQIPAFLDRLRAPVAAPVAIESSALPVRPGVPQPRLTLAADGEALLMGMRFGYGSTECGFDDPDRVFDDFAEPPTVIERDRDAEIAAWHALSALITELPPAPAILTFEGDDAYWLLANLDQLDGVEVVTDRSLDLGRWQPIGALAAVARLSADLDWFDLQVDFAVDGRTASPAAVLASWRSGRRYVRLDDGAIAALPEAWLARHADTLDELAGLRGRKRRVGLFAAPVVEGVLGDVAFEVERARAHARRLSELARRLRGFDGVADRATPPGLQASLRDYQHRGYRWMRALADLGLSGVLADDMGLGKTVQTLAALLDAHGAAPEDGRPSLVVAPTSVIHNWVAEAARFAPDLRVALHYGPQRGDVPTDVDLVITSFALLRIDAEALEGIEWRYAVLDEAQQIKNPASKVARAARGLRAAHRLALTGTPLENHLAELWSLFEFVMPGFFGSRETFRRLYAEPISQSEDDDARALALERLQRRIRPFVLRRLKREVARELPPRQEQVLSCELGGAERRLYEAVKNTYRESVLGAVDDGGVGQATIRILEALTRLRQAACDPGLLPFPEARGITDSAKRARLREVLAELTAEGHRVLVFSQWPSLLKRVRGDLERMGLDHLYLDGGTGDRRTLVERWSAPDGPPVFLISLKAGGTGLNLTTADVVIHLDPWWNPQAEQQATDRAHRIGQTKPVMVYKLVARGTVEEKVLELQARKRALFEAAVDGGRVTVDALTRADLEAVFGDG